jgi:hypothetical protein
MGCVMGMPAEVNTANTINPEVIQQLVKYMFL